MLDKEIKQRINTARQILVGKVPDPKAQVEQITTALIYKFMDDMDRENEELGGSAQFLTGELKEYAWGRLMSRELSGMERWELYTRALDTFSKSQQIPELFRRIFKGAYLPYRDAETLNLFLKEINAFSYDNSENLGNAYEYLLSILGSQGDAGQFRTPRHIIDFIVEVVNPQKRDRILDPACGTAGFLISSYKHILRVNSANYDPKTYIPAFAKTNSPDSFSTEIQQNGKYDGMNLTPDDRKRIAKNMEGYDISPDMVRLSLVNMYLHNFPAPKIAEYDTLSYEDRWNEQFDVILANPPFMTPKGGIRPHKRFRVSANRAEVLFVDYIAEHLSLNGRAGVIVPEGIIFQTANAYKQLRKMLVEDHFLYAVVSLPAGVFQPYSGVKTSVLLLDKELAKRNKEILFIKVENDGFDLGAQRRRIDKNDLPKAYEIIGKWKKGEKQASPIALWVEKSKLAENGEYNLSGDRYREAVDYTRVKWPMVELGKISTKITKGTTPTTVGYKYDVSGITFIKIESIAESGNFILEKISYINEECHLALKRSQLNENDILFSIAGALGRVAVVKKSILPANTNQALAILSLKEGIYPKYIFYILKSEKITQIITSLKVGFAQYNLSLEQVSNLQIPLPPLEVQKALVAELDGYQKIIDGARQVVDNWKPQININPDWPKVRLGDERYFKIESGGTPSSVISEYWNGKINWVTLVDLPANDFISEIKRTERTISELGLKKSSAKILPIKSILVSSRATIGRIGINYIPLATNQGFKNIIIKDFRIVNEKFVALMIVPLVPQMDLLASGGTYKEISKTSFSNLEISLPEIKTQNQIVADIEAEQQMVDNNKKLIALYEQKIKDKVKEVWGE